MTCAEYLAMRDVVPQRKYALLDSAVVLAEEAQEISEGSRENFSVAYRLVREPNYRRKGSLAEITNLRKLEKLSSDFSGSKVVPRKVDYEDFVPETNLVDEYAELAMQEQEFNELATEPSA